MNELSVWLSALRKEAKLSLPALADTTKILAKHLEALEKGEFDALPTRVHARAFALAFARACSADEDEAMQKVAAALSSKAANQETAQAAPLKSPSRFSRPSASLRPAEGAPAQDSAPESPASDLGVSTPLPWKLWSLVAVAALLFLCILHGAVSCVRSSKAPAAAAEPAAAASAAVASAQAISGTVESPADELALRSRRPCWVLLVVDGKRLPVVFLEPDKRERWLVKQKAVMLAGNIGAVRVWWRNDNLGYFGELGDRMNGVVFENGKPWRKDAAEDLPLPPGVPSKPTK